MKGARSHRPVRQDGYKIDPSATIAVSCCASPKTVHRNLVPHAYGNATWQGRCFDRAGETLASPERQQAIWVTNVRKHGNVTCTVFCKSVEYGGERLNITIIDENIRAPTLTCGSEDLCSWAPVDVVVQRDTHHREASNKSGPPCVGNESAVRGYRKSKACVSSEPLDERIKAGECKRLAASEGNFEHAFIGQVFK